MKVTYRVLELWAAQDLTTMGDNSQNSQLELLFLYVTYLLNVLYNLIKYHENILKDIELWPAQDFITMGDNLRTQSVRVVFLVCGMPTRCPLPNGEVS